MWIKKNKAWKHKELTYGGRKPRVPSVGDHELRQLADAAGVTLSAAERAVLQRLSAFVKFAGRYPIPTSPADMRPSATGSGKAAVPGFISTEELQLAEQLAARLMTEVEPWEVGGSRNVQTRYRSGGPMINQTVEDDSLFVGYSVVAYIDLMGQRDLLRKLVRLPRTPDEQQEVIRILRDTALNVKNMREALLHHFTPYAPFLLDQIPPQDRETFQQILATPTRHRGFSDSVVITVSLRSGNVIESVAGLIAVHRALLAVAAVQANFLGTLGVSIRGGIDVGLGVELFDHEYYGRALVEAYDLESKHADYPRVLVGSGLTDYLDAIERAAPSFGPPFTGLTQKFIAESRSVLRRDPDDQKLAVDPFVVITFDNGTGRAMALCREAVARAGDLAAGFRLQGDEKLAKKYDRLHRFLAASPYLNA